MEKMSYYYLQTPICIGHSNNVRISPLFSFSLIPHTISQNLVEPGALDVTKTLKDSHSDIGRNLPEACKGWLLFYHPYICCVAIEILSLKVRNGGSECICSCGCCQSKDLLCSWDEEQSELRLEVGHICNWKTFLRQVRMAMSVAHSFQLLLPKIYQLISLFVSLNCNS